MHLWGGQQPGGKSPNCTADDCSCVAVALVRARWQRTGFSTVLTQSLQKPLIKELALNRIRGSYHNLIGIFLDVDIPHRTEHIP